MGEIEGERGRGIERRLESGRRRWTQRDGERERERVCVCVK